MDDPQYADLRSGVRQVCSGFASSYWRDLEPETYPTQFVEAITQAGFLGALIPEEYGGGGATLTEASVILERSQPRAATRPLATRRCMSWAPCYVTAASSRNCNTCRN